MKLRLLGLLLFFPMVLFAQEYDFSFLHGLKSPKGDFHYEMSGNRIAVRKFTGSINNNKTYKKVKKEFGLKDSEIIATYIDETLPVANRVEMMQTSIEGSEAVSYSVLYLLQSSLQTGDAICFNFLHPRDVEFERVFIKEWLIDQFEDVTSSKLIADTIFIAGQIEILGNACVWAQPHNISFGGAQISWSEFSTLEAAVLEKELVIAKNNNTTASIIAEEELDVVFLGVPAIATRIVYMSNEYKYRLPLIVYYVATEVDGYYISSILSEYGVNRNDYELSYLLEAFMSIPELPYFAWNPYDVPMYEDYPEILVNRWNNRIHLFEIGGSLWIPLGDLTNVFGPSPALHITLGFPIKEVFAIDINAQFAFLLRQRDFNYFHDNITEETTASSLIHIGGRFRYQHKLGKDTYLNPYIGIGYHEFLTDLETEDSTPKEKDYHSFGTLDLSGGLILRYKGVGLFMEYHYSKYSRSKHIDKGFGHSGLNIGLFYSW